MENNHIYIVCYRTYYDDYGNIRGFNTMEEAEEYKQKLEMLQKRLYNHIMMCRKRYNIYTNSFLESGLSNIIRDSDLYIETLKFY